MKLSKAQEAAVLHTAGPALVIAGAGSGKTRTLTAKIAHLLETGMPPERILAITFTNKAADEMKQRLVRQTGLGLERFPWVRTYHSACLQILKPHARLMGFHPPIQILSTYQQQKIIQEILIRMNINKKEAPKFHYTISMAKNHGDPEDYIQFLPEIARIQTREVFAAYEKQLMEMNAVDFDNILLKTRDLLRNFEEVRSSYRNLFQYILVDEYQDSNNLQEELTRLLLGHGRLFCVGDDWQSVYGFRGSNVTHFLRFQQNYPDAVVFRLEENYRSADEIVQAAGALIEHNAGRMEKNCFSKKLGGTVETYHFYTEEEEAKWVGRKIYKLMDTGVPLEKIAVIYRTKFCSLAFEKVFRSMKLPYRMLGSKGFFERMEILDLNSYLAASVFPKDDASFERILNTPKRGIGPAMIKKIQQARLPNQSFQESARAVLEKRLLSEKIHQSLHELFLALDDIRYMTPNIAIKEIIARTGYMAYLEQASKSDKGDFTSRQENIEELIYTAGARESIEAYLEEAALIREDRDEEEDKTRGVNLVTAHASKGLEFHSVFVVACEEELFPHWKALQDGELEEERRLMYVAMTRAERCLFISSSHFRRGNPAKA
ncbi:UvrD-helicase domain-containing protein, partial [Desulfococcaceae bacterium OttesenSCG-928-F15]|nr:UvrD-helicase domain-containing protein [Desulfococcaceae bacterium OttesenSCG-928-F15]